jgi:transcriptional regulator GlxA family with amidase domain
MTAKAPLQLHVLALIDCAPIVPVGVIDLLRKSVELAATLPPPKGRARRGVELTLVSADATTRLTTAGGLAIHCDATIGGAGRADLVVVSALDPDIVARIDENRRAIPYLRRAHARGADLASACTGAFLLAEAGLLDGRAATTHWAFQPLFAERYPRVRLMPQAIIVDQGRVVTAGGATSFVNLALFLVERLLGPDVAWAASRMFLIEPNKSPQSAYAAFSTQKGHGDEAILRAQELIERDVARAPSVDDIARKVALSRRTFARRFRDATGDAPRDYILRVRVEAAKRALERGLSVQGAAERAGYGDAVAFRKIFVRLAGLTPADYRSRYGPRAAPAWVPTRASRARAG